MREPQLVTATNVVNGRNVKAQVNGRWIPARFECWQKIRWFRRIRLAYGVLVGRYDALDWEY